MKNKISKYSFLFLLLLAVFLVSSCDFFTNSVLSFAARDTAETVKSTPTNALVSAGSNPSVVGDQNMAQTYLEELGNRPEDLENLKTEEAENVMNLATAALLPVSNFQSILDSMVDNGNQEGGEGENPEQDNNNILASILDSIPSVDTTALEKVLENEKTVQEADISTTAMATISLLGSAIKTEANEGDTTQLFGQITQNLGSDAVKTAETTEDKVNAVLQGTGASEDNTALKTAIAAALVLSQREDLSSLSIGGFDLGQLFGVQTDNGQNNG